MLFRSTVGGTTDVDVGAADEVNPFGDAVAMTVGATFVGQTTVGDDKAVVGDAAGMTVEPGVAVGTEPFGEVDGGSAP